jgi:hypothetical protein
MLETCAASGQRHFVIVFHSFSAVKPKDGTYSSMRPDRIVIRRLEKLMDYLRSRSDIYRVCTFDELAKDITVLEEGPEVVAKLGLVEATVRKAIQGVNRCYWL